MRATYTVTGLHCASCVQKIQTDLKNQADTVSLDLASGRLHLENPRLDFPALKERIRGLGSYDLQEEETAEASTTGVSAYYPLILIVTYLAIAANAGAENVEDWMRHFMAGFFLVFSFFKLLNLKAFAEGYASYDLVAKRWPPYAYVYPFIELAFGFAYLFDWRVGLISFLTLVVMLVSAAGVLRAVADKRKLRCACLGTLLNVPLSTVTLVEDFGMAAMAALMLVM